ncbi:MAG: hypothetical protein RSF40_01365 [Oscillospiraceae bacterium]
MKIFSKDIPLEAQHIDIQSIKSEEGLHTYFPIINEDIISKFSSKYETRLVTSVNIVWVDDLDSFSLIVNYNNDEITVLHNGKGMVLCDKEVKMLNSLPHS